jgi:prepilin-type N-terminal cleavage/methylation domain-containing protein/prepilin-type processing-associated H-X9-DG protein
MKSTKILRSSRQSNGFTLMEILVTITIIIVLAALTFMGTKKLREGADTVTTISRIKGFVNANALYATDHNGKYVAIYANDGDGKPLTPWHFNPEFLGSLIGELDITDAVQYEGVPGLPEAVLDPVVVRAKKYYWDRISASFGYNDENLPGGGWGDKNTYRAHTVASVKFPSEHFAFITATDWLAKYNGRFRWEKNPVEGKSTDGKIAFRHGKKAVVAYYDGHTETKTIEQIRAIDNLGGRNNVFWGGTKRSR